MSEVKLWSEDISHKKSIPPKFTDDGEDINPHLAWSDVPPEAKSLALIVDDPDAPKGTWTHWLVDNIPPRDGQIAQGEIPEGAKLAKNDFGKMVYGGPSPPSGTHRYFFKLYALDIANIGTTEKKDFYKIVEEHKIDEAQLMGLYSKK
ncbi:MAG: YbhB/YbcL family Raf kinase inhibitor-like protein [Thermoplasmatota archaeon]